MTIRQSMGTTSALQKHDRQVIESDLKALLTALTLVSIDGGIYEDIFGKKSMMFPAIFEASSHV